MDDVTHAQDLIGNDVYDSDGDKIGRVGNVYVDDSTHQPEWVTVRTGLFGMKESFVPLEGASTRENRINLGVSRDKVKEAPRVDAEHGHLSDQEGKDLYTYYGIERRGASAPLSAAGTDRPQSERPNPSHMPGARPAEAMTVPETGRHHRSESEAEDPRVVPPSGQGGDGKHRKEDKDD